MFSLLLHVVFWFVWFLCFVASFIIWAVSLFWGGGFKGQVKWPAGPPHLALKDPP